MTTYGLEIGIAYKGQAGSEYEVRPVGEDLGQARAALAGADVPEHERGYVSLVELDHGGCPCRTIETRGFGGA